MKPRRSILSGRPLRREIQASHERSLAFGVCREERSPDQKRLSPEELEACRRASKDLLDVASGYIEEFYELLSPDKFMIAVVDSDGFILHLSGSEAIQAEFAERNCAPGFRFTEEEVGTTAISLCLRKRVALQLNDQDHFCIRAHGFTSSAAPIFGDDDRLQGVLVVSGKSHLVHPHTLIMVTSAARSIEKQMRLLRRNRETSVYAGFLDNVLESAETGLLALDRELRIWKTNRKARRILMQDRLEGKPIGVLDGLEVDLDDICRHPESWNARECDIRSGRGTVHLIYSAQPVRAVDGRVLGVVVVFENVQNIRAIADKISVGRAFFTFEHILGASEAIRNAVSLARRAARSRSTVLLLGETGTGKELFAQAIHNAGPLRTKPFVPINCGAIPGELMESELFGYADGAFSGALKGGRPGKFELAGGGTILLDEIGDMPHHMQVKLLRVLQTGEVQRVGDSAVVKVDARVIASTNMELTRAIEENRFRSDLYYRLNILTIPIPPLRERGAGDIGLLADYFVRQYAPRCRLSREAARRLSAYHWPGNVRELENTIQRALHVCDGKAIRPEHITLPAGSGSAAASRRGSLRRVEREVIAETLETTGFNMAEAAKILGISRATLYRKVKTFRIERPAGRKELERA